MTEETKTILIFGVSSLIGSNLAEFLKKDYKVVGTYFKNPVTIPGVLTLPCDVLNKDEVQLVLYAFKPDFTIYSVGLSSLEDCSKNESVADALNTMGLFNVAEYCQRYKAQIVYFSSGYVFGGENNLYKEMDIPDTNSTLGKTKASAEFYLQKTSLNYLIFRCGNIYGRSLNHNQTTWFERLQTRIFKSESISCDNLVYAGFLDVYYLAMILKLSFKKGVSNRLFQISSSDSVTYYDFAKMYCETFNESTGHLSKGKWHFPHVASTASNYAGGELHYSLDTVNIESFLNLSLPTVEESIQFTFNRFHGVKASSKNNKSEDVVFI
jgi:dTDP-4-dehydrorhamnose reductase